jgi:hypothetical protein
LLHKGRIVIGYVLSGVVAGGLLTVQTQLGYPRPFDLIVLGIYDVFVVIHLLTVVAQPIWLFLFLPIAGAEIWVAGGLSTLLFFLSLAVVIGVTAELDPFRKTLREDVAV